MSSVRFVFPKSKLEQLIRAPGGLTVAEALARADANLETIRPTCRAELMLLLQETENRLADLKDNDEAGLAHLYALGVRGIGAGAVCGLPDVDVALGSLCELIDRLQTGRRFDREAVAVHVRAWRLLMDPAMPKAGSAAVLTGLDKVTAHYAAPRPPEEPA